MISPEAIERFLSGQRALVIDSFSASRGTLRKIMLELGVKPNNLSLCENFVEAEPVFQACQPSFVIAEQLRGTKSAFKAFDITRMQYPNRMDAIFIMTADGEDPLLLNRVENEEMDGLLSRPFTYASAFNRISELIHARVSLTPYGRALGEGRSRMHQGRPLDAIEEFVRARAMDPRPSQAWSLEGHARRQLGQALEALPCFEQALRYDPADYRALSGKVDTLFELNDIAAAYDASTQLMSKHPIRPLRIPALVRVAIRSGKFEDVLGFYDKLAELPEPEPSVTNAVVAGLLVCAKHLVKKDDRAGAAAALKKAVLASGGKPLFTREIAAGMIGAGMLSEAAAILASAPAEIRDSHEVRMAELLHASRFDSPARVLEMGMGFIKSGLRDPQLYEVVISKSLELNRRPEAIEELVAEATRSFPEQAPVYEGLLRPTSNRSSV